MGGHDHPDKAPILMKRIATYLLVIGVLLVVAGCNKPIREAKGAGGNLPLYPEADTLEPSFRC